MHCFDCCYCFFLNKKKWARVEIKKCIQARNSFPMPVLEYRVMRRNAKKSLEKVIRDVKPHRHYDFWSKEEISAVWLWFEPQVPTVLNYQLVEQEWTMHPPNRMNVTDGWEGVANNFIKLDGKFFCVRKFRISENQ